MTGVRMICNPKFYDFEVGNVNLRLQKDFGVEFNTSGEIWGIFMKTFIILAQDFFLVYRI